MISLRAALEVTGFYSKNGILLSSCHIFEEKTATIISAAFIQIYCDEKKFHS
jgi:hypothetical protein